MGRRSFAFLILSFALGALAYFWLEPRSHQEKAMQVWFAQNEALNFYHQEDLLRVLDSLEFQNQDQNFKFENVPFVEKAVWSHSFTGAPRVNIYLQKPMMSFYHKGRYRLINRQGETFSELPQYKVPNVPVMRGGRFLTQKNRKKALGIFQSLPKEGLLSQETLSEVLFEEEPVFVFSGINGKVYLDATKVSEKADRLSKVLKYLRFHGMEARVLDARFQDRVVVSLKE